MIDSFSVATSGTFTPLFLICLSFYIYIFFYHRRCWDLSAGNLKWIYQVPILVAVVVSTRLTFPPAAFKNKSISHHLCDYCSSGTNTPFHVVIKSNMCHFAYISLFRLILCYFWTSSESWQLNYGKPTLAGVTPDNSTGTSCLFSVALISSLLNPSSCSGSRSSCGRGTSSWFTHHTLNLGHVLLMAVASHILGKRLTLACWFHFI